MYRIPAYLFLLLFTLTATAQSKLLTMEEAVIGQWGELYPQNLRNVQWQGESTNFTFQDYQNLYQHSLQKNDSLILISLSELNQILTQAKLDSLSYFPRITWETANEFHFNFKNNWYAVSLKQKELLAFIKLPAEAQNQTLAYKKKMIAYTLANNLYVMGTDNQAVSLTTNTDKNIVCGQAVSRSEFGIDGGIFWSPSADYIAFYRKDESKVRNYPLVDISAREAELNNIKYPMAGMASEHISLGVYKLSTKSTTFIEAGDTLSEKYLTNVTWSPDENFIYIQVLNRDQNHMKLNKYAVADGKLALTLFEEKNSKYVEPYHTLLFLDNKKDQFIYQTRNNGYNHAYLYTTDGNLVKQITTGNWEITEILAYKNNVLYYTSTEASPIESHLYKIHINSGKKQQLTSLEGTHSITLNPSTKYFIDNYSSTLIPRNIRVCNSKGNTIRTVLAATNPLLDYKMSPPEIGTLKADDGVTDLYYRLIKPVDFDSTKKYPAIIYVYGGPHAQLIENRWLAGARMWNYLMAQKGYVMLTIDNRGSANRGLEFENIIHRQCGVTEMKDQMKGIALLEQSGYVDMDRIGVHGWSYGGFMTTSLMVNHADVFKVGVAGGPVIDWKYYEVMYGERYMDTPEQNPEGYLVTSLVPRVKDLNGKLLIIHGGIDPTVVMQHSQVFIQECIQQGVPVDYFIYPRAEHNMRGTERIHLMNKVTRYFEDYLK